MDSFKSHATLTSNGRQLRYASLAALQQQGYNLERLPYALRILLENLLRREDGQTVCAGDIEALLQWEPQAEPNREIAFMPGRVLLQDFTGVPAVVDLAAMRDAMVHLGGDPQLINPLIPAELVIDHSVQVDRFGTPQAFAENVQLEFERNRERYAFLRWGQKAFNNFAVVPPDTGICHQINLEYLARLAMTNADGWVYPDTVIGTDSHTVMINGLGVLGWGVGGIEAEAAMLGQPVSMLIPQVVGVRLSGALAEGATATDVVLRVVELLRQKGVVGKFVEFYGPGLSSLPLADRAVIANMGPEYGATCGLFPVDETTLGYLELTGRKPEQIALVEEYFRTQGLLQTAQTPDPEYSDTCELDLGLIEPCLSGPKRPQDRIPLKQMQSAFRDNFERVFSRPRQTPTSPDKVTDGSVVIASITSCTNTSNPSVMIAAGLVAAKAVKRGLTVPNWVKTSLAPGSQVVTAYLQQALVMEPLEKLGFHNVGYGCATCIGNSGPLIPEVSQEIDEKDLVAVAVLSGNRNFEGRVHAQVRANYLASPPLVVAYALAGRIDIDFDQEPLGFDADQKPVYLKDLWPSNNEIAAVAHRSVNPEMFAKCYSNVFAGSTEWNALDSGTGHTFEWQADSSYIKQIPFFQDIAAQPTPFVDIQGARVLAVLGDSITTDHISPAGSIKPDSPAGRYLQELGIAPKDFNSYGSRRGNHEVMMRGTFANIRLRNQLVPEVEGGFTRHLPDGEQLSIYDAAMRYAEESVPLIILAGQDYGCGSSRDWAAKGPRLLGVRAVIARSFERIHRSNLVGMGVLPLQFQPGEDAQSLGLTGCETFDLAGLAEFFEQGFDESPRTVGVRYQTPDGQQGEFSVRLRLDTPQEVEYCRHGGILSYVLRQLAQAGPR